MDRDLLLLRSRILELVRSFFRQESYVEVEVPLLTRAPIPEHTIELFRTVYIDRHDAEHTLFLTPSPEIYLKRLLSQGVGNLFCVSKAFRNVEQQGIHHNPEFTMLEYYSVEADYRDSERLTKRLISSILAAAGDEIRAYRRGRGRSEEASWWESFADRERAPENPSEGVDSLPGATLKELFARYAGLDLDALIPDRKGVDEFRGFEVLFHKVLLEKIEPNIPLDKPFILWDYPSALRTLATETPDPRYAQRWELYIEGIEVANCFTEEVDPAAVEAYFRDEQAFLKEVRVPRPVDADYPSIFAGMRPCSGVALGIDRLVAVLLGEKSIKQVMFSAISDMMK